VGALVVLALVTSIIGIRNGFTYDDKYIIEWNTNVHSLANGAWVKLFAQSYWPKEWGSDGYRPLTMLLFAIEWAVGRGTPMIFHAVNIALNVATTIAVFGLASLLLPSWAAWLAAALFAVHPVHVEAVANIVGQSEIIVGFLTTVALYLYLRDRKSGPLRERTAFTIVALYATACLIKEHGIVLPALLVVAELLLVSDTRSIATRLREQLAFALGLVAVALAFVAVRSVVLSENGVAGFHPFIVFQTLKLSYADRVLTMLGVVPEWMRLVLWPARLSMDYTPPMIGIAQGLAIEQLPGFLLLVAVLGLAVALWRRRPVTSFGITLAVVTLLPSSNFVIPAGIILAERTLYLPTVGVLLVVADAFAWLAPWERTRQARALAVAGLTVIVVAGVAWSARRTTVWQDNERLFRQTVADYPNSYRAHFMLGSWAFANRRLAEGEHEFQAAIELFPFDPSPAMGLAEQYRLTGACPQAIKYYRVALKIDPKLGRIDLAKCLVHVREYAEAKNQLRSAMEYSGATPYMHRLLVWVDTKAAADSAAVLPR
jgi:hypothetical protein